MQKIYEEKNDCKECKEDVKNLAGDNRCEVKGCSLKEVVILNILGHYQRIR